MDADEFDRFWHRLRDGLAERDDVVGLVLMGSTAARDRVDEWSDHDFAVVVTDGAQDRLRGDLSWLPDADRIALAAPEEHGGMKVVYDSGHVLEFGAAALSGLASWHANAYEVVLDRGGVAEAFTRVAARDKPSHAARVDRELGLFAVVILVGIGRYRRGEVLVASQLVRTIAVGHLITACRLAVPSARADVLDDLDPFRRFELAYPKIGQEIAAALERDVESAARAVFDLAERELGRVDGFPSRGVAAIRARLGWPPLGPNPARGTSP